MESGKRKFKRQRPYVVELNHYLEITRSRIHQIYRELETSDKVITVDLVRKLYYGVDEKSKTLLQVFREHNEQSRKLIGKDFVSKTVQRYETYSELSACGVMDGKRKENLKTEISNLINA